MTAYRPARLGSAVAAVRVHGGAVCRHRVCRQHHPGANDPIGNMSWSQIQTLAANGRWEIAFHTGEYGHGDYSDPTSTIDLGGGETLSYASTCWTYTPPRQHHDRHDDGCRHPHSSRRRSRPRSARVSPNSSRRFQAQACSPGPAPGTLVASGQLSTTTQAARCRPGYRSIRLPVPNRLHPDRPQRLRARVGTVGSLTSDNRRYRFEVLTTTTLVEFAAALSDPSFAAR